MPGVEIVRSSIAAPRRGAWRSIPRRIGWRLHWPFDSSNENRQLLRIARETRPDVVFIYNSRLVRRSTLRKIRKETGALLVYFSTDDALAKHNMSIWMKTTFPTWDLFYTLKRFNVAELREEGVKLPVLTNNIFTPELHRPMTREEVGEGFESFDLVFVGTFEPEREGSLRKLAEAGFRILIHGNAAGLLYGSWERLKRAGITVRPAADGIEYARAIHHGKVPLGFLRKLNRDEITHRSFELPGMKRAMLGEKTPEHDLALVDGSEYIGFTDDDDLVAKARLLVEDAALRERVATAGHARVFASGYDVDTAMRRIVDDLRRFRAGEPIGHH